MTTNIVPITERFAALARVDSIREAITENMGKGGMSVFDLPRLKIAAGGLPAFESLDVLTGETDTVKSFDGVLVTKQDGARAFYMSADPTGEAPDCSSTDGTEGYGVRAEGEEPSAVLCEQCPHNQFGTAVRSDGSAGGGKRCKEKARLFVLRWDTPDSVFPTLLEAPPSSLRVLKKFMAALTAHGVPYWRALLRFEVRTEVATTGQKYGELKLSLVRRLEDGEAKAVDGYRAAIGSALAKA